MTWHIVNIVHKESYISIFDVLLKNRNIQEKWFFDPDISELHDPFLMPDMEKGVERILEAREKHERIVIFWDYDVDGVSSTAILVRFLTEIGCIVSYRLPHRVHDGYGLKSYFFDELAKKEVKLVITVDCGTRDIEPIKHAKSLGIDVIVTDHHAVPDIIPEEVIAILNPKRKDSLYPFRDLAGAGVAFKLLHGILIELWTLNLEPWTRISETLMQYIDFAALGTVSDCMPIIWENRTITTLGLRQMTKSKSYWLRKFLEERENLKENDADIIGFQIGPRINAAGRMDTPMKALQWLLAGEQRADELFGELEYLNETRKWTTIGHFEKALEHIDTSKPILIYDAEDLEHGIIWLVAGKLTEMYNKPAIVLKNGSDHPLTSRKWDTVTVDSKTENWKLKTENSELSIASCRAPEWCDMIKLLDSCREYFIRYGGHRQAAGFTVETSRLEELKNALYQKMWEFHDVANLPKKTINIECILDMSKDITLENISIIDRFRPFGIGNAKPLFLLKDETILECAPLGKEWKHLQLRLASNPRIKLVAWGWGEEWRMRNEEWGIEKKVSPLSKGVGGISSNPNIPILPDYTSLLQPGNIVSFIVELEKNEWNGKESVSIVVKELIIE
jgi:single-stranded-DNA-specific exonuclease